MRIRTQLILAAFVLAVLPLAGIVVWSYHSSREALESAYRTETEKLTRLMDRRLSTIRADLDRRLTVVSALPIPTEASREDVRDIVSVMGDSASIVDALEFHPVRAPRAPEQRAETPAISSGEQEPSPGQAARTHRTVRVASTPHVPAVPASSVAGDVSVSVPVVIDIPNVGPNFHFEMSEAQQEAIQEISALGRQLSSEDLSPEERQDIAAELEKAQSDFQKLLAMDREKRQKQVDVAMQRLRSSAAELQRAFPAGVPAPEAPPQKPEAPASVAPGASVQVHAPAATSEERARREEERQTVARKDTEAARRQAEKTALILGRKFAAPVRKQGEIVGQLTAQVRPEEVIQRILGDRPQDQDGEEIPFAIDKEGSVYTRTAKERQQLDLLGVIPRIAKGEKVQNAEGWIVSSAVDSQSGLRVGVARPVGDSFEALRRTAARNFFLGMGLIAFALIGIVPLSNHLTRDVKLVTDGAERIAQGDLMTRLPVKTNNELGQLAKAFNRMAADLSENQQKLLEQERTQREQEMQQRLLAMEYERKSVELEDARRFQLSMLPKDVPHLDSCEIAAYTRTATEVGGDYYDFRHDGELLSIAIGDATGHGAKAGTMVTVIKTLFAGYEGRVSPAAFLADSAEKIKRMELGRMAMALSLARLEKRRLLVASAGMPPVLVHRAATGTVEELALSATPLGTLGSEYPEAALELEPRDTVLFMSDGFPELLSSDGQQLGYVAATEAFAEAARSENAQGVIASLVARAERWHGSTEPNDDVTFIAVRVV